MKILQAPFQFRGGVHPPDHKARTEALPTVPVPLPPTLRVALLQHLGAPARALVKAGDKVLRGQPVGEAAGVISAAVHAPTSGVVTALVDAPTPSGRMAPHVVIESDGADERTAPLPPWTDWAGRNPRDLVARIAEAGVVGMGGAGFPTRVKLSPPADKPIDTLILNGAECEPYLTSDHRILLEHARRIWEGCRILQHVLNAPKLRIAIESNKPDAIRAMAEAAGHVEGDAAILVLDTRYPQGSEKQQIYAVTGREVPPAGLPMDVGCLVENVGTTLAVQQAVVEGLPLDERVITVAGPGIVTPRNVRARIGTAFAELVAACDGLDPDTTRLIAGGPMMGFAQHSLDVTVTKTTSGLLALRNREAAAYGSAACIGCGRCNDTCPMRLLPSELAQAIEADDLNTAETLYLMDCFECGACAYACPAHRPLVQHMRRAKSALLLKRRLEKASS